ncbi:MAG: CDP-alcohol phosphatidyltransferase family protein [Candidatus Bathyarchaeota archaeon]|nr:CDP-alcohol phosphatidyltransferase family protein [Candidatus Bathyarchaeota archaeon]
MNKKAFVPSGISTLRLVALPLFLYFFTNGATAGCIVVFGFAQLTDLVDGYVARKLGVTSKFGAYFDAATDFVLVTGIFVAFTLSNYYSAWILLLIVASFTQFIVTSRFHKKLYDPLGKYIGSVLYLAIGLTLLSPTEPVFLLVEVGFSVFAVASFVTRTVSLSARYKRNLLIRREMQRIKLHSA